MRSKEDSADRKYTFEWINVALLLIASFILILVLIFPCQGDEKPADVPSGNSININLVSESNKILKNANFTSEVEKIVSASFEDSDLYITATLKNENRITKFIFWNIASSLENALSQFYGDNYSYISFSSDTTISFHDIISKDFNELENRLFVNLISNGENISRFFYNINDDNFVDGICKEEAKYIVYSNFLYTKGVLGMVNQISQNKPYSYLFVSNL